MKAEILKMLRESKEYVSGQQLCERLQVSRTAVWKVIKQLENEGDQKKQRISNCGMSGRAFTRGDRKPDADRVYRKACHLL